jgi:threonine 3-dehydrogenase
MKILITGAAGQVGTDLLPLLTSRGDVVTVLDLTPKPATCPAGVTWVRGDITLAQEVSEAVKQAQPERILHLAAILSATGESVPHRAWRVNMEGTHHVLEAARLFGVKQVFFTSTIAAFGPGLADPVGNDVSMRPTTMYGVTKVAGELLGEYYQKAFGIDFRGVRFPGLINAGIPGGGTTDYALWMFIDGLRTGAYECFVSAGSRVPFMYMPDALRAVIELMDAPKSKLTRSIYNIAAMSPTAEEIAAEVRRNIPGVRLSFKSDPRRQAILDSWPHVLDDTLARRDWGWKNAYDLKGMVEDLMPRMRRLVETNRDLPVHA